MAQAVNALTTESASSIIDIRNGADLTPLTEQIRSSLTPKDGGEKKLPTLLLYNEAGLKLFEKITYLDEYYLTGQEIEVLEQNAERIAERIALQPDSMVIELGSGNLRKVKILLDALDRQGKAVSYYALDLSQKELERTLAEIPQGTFKHVQCFGLLGTYDDGLAWLKQAEYAKRPKTILSLGSSIGNFPRNEAAEFLSQFVDIFTTNDSFLLGIDGCTDGSAVYHAYNDREGLTHEFILNGLKHANELLDREVFHVPDWQVIGEYDEQAGRHHAFVAPLKDVTVEGVNIGAGERVRIEESYKYDADQRRQLWNDAGVTEGASWTNTGGNYALNLLARPKVAFPMKPEDYAASPVPSLDDWEAVWAAWDTVTQEMIPKEELLSKPIKLRNACIFYLGHIPTFLDIHLTRATDGKPTEPAYYSQIFERGIDPDVDNPEQCHAHSEVPDDWPPAAEILDFQTSVRMRVRKQYTSGQIDTDRQLRRVMWLGYEHEMMHLETLLYMLIQSEKTLPPPSTIKPDFESLAKQAREAAVTNEWFKVPEQKFTIGINDPDDNSAPEAAFGWDIEKPARDVDVGAFEIKARPITNGEYAAFLEQAGDKSMPASWTEAAQANGVTDGQSNGHTSVSHEPSQSYVHGKAVRTVYGNIPLKFCLDWPCSASYNELSACAAWMGGRIPTMEEARSVYKYVEEMKILEALNASNRKIPAVNGHLVNDGVEESPPSKSSSDGSSAVAGSNPQDLYVNLEGANVGLKHWHPMPVTQNGNKLGGQGDMGGLWEWTSTALTKHEGYSPMPLYPAYSSDFFDDKHNVVLGGSWATPPHIAGRMSFVNWYQRNYLYVWAGARVVRDI